MAVPESAALAAKVLSNVMRYAVGLGVGASVLQTSLYTGQDFSAFTLLVVQISETAGD